MNDEEKMFKEIVEPFASLLLYMNTHNKPRADIFIRHFIGTFAMTITNTPDEAIQYIKQLAEDINDDIAEIDRRRIKKGE